MHVSRRLAALSIGLVVTAAALSGCGSSGSSGTTPVAKASGTGCAPVAGTQLVVLTDDKHLQLSDNLVAAANKSVGQPAIDALNKVNAAIDQPKLLALNKSVDVDRQSPAVAAQAFATSANLTTGITKGPGGKLIVGSGSFSEAQEMAELYKIVLTAAGYDVTVQKVGARDTYLKPMEKNQIQIVPEYAASLTNQLATDEGGASATLPASGDINTTMSVLKTLGGKVNLIFGTPSTATDVNAFAVTQATATKYGLKTLSDFAAKCSGTASTLAGPSECPQRPFCEQGLEKTYGITFGQFKTMGTDTGGPITKKAITSGEVTIGLVFSSDSSFAS